MKCFYLGIMQFFHITGWCVYIFVLYSSLFFIFLQNKEIDQQKVLQT